MTSLNLPARLTPLLMILLAAFALIMQGCGGGGGNKISKPGAPSDRWTWMSGSDTAAQLGVYGSKGIANAANVPGARSFTMSKTDADGDLWLFGGNGVDSAGDESILNDLWRWDGNNWTWVSGSDVTEQSGNYGVKGVADIANVPGARIRGVTWVDTSDDFWLFGGIGFDSAGTVGRLNDLWRWDGSNWTWISGSDVVNQSGVYGVKGTPAGSNMPGARRGAVSWSDSSGNFWLFGGSGYDSAGASSSLNDLWRWDGSEWTWVSGSDVVRQPGVYGEKGIVAGSNEPGARSTSVEWTDASGNFWLFGGAGRDSAGSSGNLNDLWRWDGDNWTWVSGSNIVSQIGIYGTKGIADATNVPGAREFPVSWIGANGSLWLFGGWGYDSTGTVDHLNDLWRWDGSEWIWVSGSNVVNQSGSYGTKGISDATNAPGARNRFIAWTDISGNLWFFGGEGYDGTGNFDILNDMWRYQP